MTVSSYHSYDTSDVVARELSRQVADDIRLTLDERGHAKIAVSGGTTPLLFFDYLSREELDWTRTTITLVDDRCVPVDHERSNEGLVRERLLINNAQKAEFDPILGRSGETLLDPPCDVTVLGMGADGHTASLFANGNNYSKAINPDTAIGYMDMDSPDLPESRITMTLPNIVQSKNLYLHIEGQEKADVLENALNSPAFPIHHIVRHPATRLKVRWAAGKS